MKFLRSLVNRFLHFFGQTGEIVSSVHILCKPIAEKDCSSVKKIIHFITPALLFVKKTAS